MRTKPTYQQLNRAVGNRVKVKRHNMTADIRRVLESDSTLLQQALASDPGQMVRAVAKMPAKPLARAVRKQALPTAPQRPGSSGDIAPFAGTGRTLEALDLFSGKGVKLPKRARGQAIIERGAKVQANWDARALKKMQGT